jgi:hypothetical protein
MNMNTYKWAERKGIIKWCRICGVYHDYHIECPRKIVVSNPSENEEGKDNG